MLETTVTVLTLLLKSFAPRVTTVWPIQNMALRLHVLPARTVLQLVLLMQPLLTTIPIAHLAQMVTTVSTKLNKLCPLRS